MKKKTVIITAIAAVAAIAIGVGVYLCLPKSEEPVEPSRPVETQPVALPDTKTEYEFEINAAYETMMHAAGYREFVADYHRWTATTPYPCDFHKLTMDGDIAILEFDYASLDVTGEEMEWSDGWKIYATKATEAKDITDLAEQEWDETNIIDYNELFPDDINTYRDVFEYDYVKTVSDTEDALAVNMVIYYPESGNLYNIYKIFDNPEQQNLSMPSVLWEDEESALMYQTLNSQVITEDEFPIEIAEFKIKTDKETKTYKYRVGMTLAAWASSELNEGKYRVGYLDYVVSDDYQYVYPEAAADIRFLTDENDTIEFINVKDDEDLATVAYDTEQSLSFVSTPVAVAHIVNYKTPLLINKVQIANTYENGGSKLFQIGSMFLPDEENTLYLDDIEDNVLKDMKMYVFKEPTEFRLEIQANGFDSHVSPYSADEEWMQIPADAYEVSFERCENEFTHDEDEDIDILTRENIIKATWNPVDTGLDEFNENVIAITYKDKVVCWIHLPNYINDNGIFDFTEIDIIIDMDGNIILESETKTEEELAAAKEYLMNNEEFMNRVREDMENGFAVDEALGDEEHDHTH